VGVEAFGLVSRSPLAAGVNRERGNSGRLSVGTVSCNPVRVDAPSSHCEFGTAPDVSSFCPQGAVETGGPRNRPCAGAESHRPGSRQTGRFMSVLFG